MKCICIDCNDKDWIFPLIIGENDQEKDITSTLPFMTDLPSFLGNYVLGEEILNK